MKVRDRLLQFEEQKKSHVGLVIFVVFLLLGLLIGILYYYRDTINNTLDVDSSNDVIDNDSKINNAGRDEFKKYDSESGLYIPTLSEDGSVFYGTNENIVIKMVDIKGDSTGYTISLTFEQNSGYMRNAKVNRVYIDGYDTSVKEFAVYLSSGYVDKHTIHITKTELDELEINDFDKLTLNMTIDEIGKSSINRYFELDTNQILSANNKEKDLTRIASLEKIQINYYKKIVDNDNTYLYFLINDISLVNDTYYRKSNIFINKMIINNEVYDTDISCDVYGYSKKMFVISIPRKEINNVEQLSISFIISVNIDNNFSGYYFSNQVNVDLN